MWSVRIVVTTRRSPRSAANCCPGLNFISVVLRGTRTATERSVVSMSEPPQSGITTLRFVHRKGGANRPHPANSLPALHLRAWRNWVLMAQMRTRWSRMPQRIHNRSRIDGWVTRLACPRSHEIVIGMAMWYKRDHCGAKRPSVRGASSALRLSPLELEPMGGSGTHRVRRCSGPTSG